MRDPRDRHKPSCITLHICCNEYYIPVPYTVLDINRNFGCPNLCQVLPGTYINSSMVWYIIFRRRLVRQTLLQLQKSSHTNSKQFGPQNAGAVVLHVDSKCNRPNIQSCRQIRRRKNIPWYTVCRSSPRPAMYMKTAPTGPLK